MCEEVMSSPSCLVNTTDQSPANLVRASQGVREVLVSLEVDSNMEILPSPHNS